MPLEFDLEPTCRVMAAAVALCAAVWAAAPLSRHLVKRTTRDLLAALRDKNVRKKNTEL